MLYDLPSEGLTFEALHFAWRRVEARGGRAGADGVSISRFAMRSDAFLVDLLDEVAHGDYAPGPIRTVTMLAGAKHRQISILTVRDRILQRAVLDLLTPSIDPTFLSCSYGYRPGRSLHDAVAQIVQLRDRGFPWIIDADVRDCFGSLDHDRLRRVVRDAVPRPGLQSLLSSWIAYPVQTGRRSRKAGIPLGAPISPLLCNLYLHQLDASLTERSLKIIRYADDFVILCKSEAHAERALRSLEKVVAGLDLELNPVKTRIASFDDGFEFLGVRFAGSDYSFEVEGKRIHVDELVPEDFVYHADGYE